MAIKVGINGFGRIGRNVLRDFAQRSQPGIRRGQRPDGSQDAGPPAEIRLGSRQSAQPGISAGADSITVDGKTIKVFKERDPACAALGIRGRAGRDRIDRTLHRRQ